MKISQSVFALLIFDQSSLNFTDPLFLNDPEKQRSLTGSSSQKLSRFRFKFFEPEPGSELFAEILGPRVL